MYKILIADDHPLFREAIHNVIADGFPGSEVMETADLDSALGLNQEHDDLDLILLYDRPEEAGPSDGARSLDPVTWHVRFTQRLVAALTVPTRRGTLYQVDMRLRPTGNKSPAATQFSASRPITKARPKSGRRWP